MDQGQIDKFIFLRSTDPNAAREYLGNLSPEDLTALHQGLTNAAPPAGEEEKPLSEVQLGELASAAINFRNYINANNLTYEDVPEFGQLLDAVPPSQREQFTSIVNATGRPEGHPDASALMRFNLENLSTPEEYLNTASRFVPPDKYEFRLNPAGEVEMRVKGQGDFYRVDPDFARSIGRLDFEDVKKDIVEAAPGLIAGSLLPTAGSALGTALMTRAGGIGAKFAAPLIKKLTPKVPKYIPRLAGMTGNISGGAFGGMAGEVLRQTAAGAAGNIREMSPQRILEAGAAETVGAFMGGVPKNMPATGSLGYLGKSPGVVQKYLREGYGLDEFGNPITFTQRDLRPMEKAVYDFTSHRRGIQSPDVLPPALVREMEANMPEYMQKLERQMIAPNRVSDVAMAEEIVSDITRGVKSRLEELGDELNKKYSLVKDIDLSQLGKDFKEAYKVYNNKALIDEAGLSSEDLRMLNFLKTQENKLLERTHFLRPSDYTEEERKLSRSLGLTLPRVIKKKSKKIPLFEAQQMKQSFQDQAAILWEKRKREGGLARPLEDRLKFYEKMADTYKTAIEDSVAAAEQAQTSLVGKSVDRPLSAINAEYSDMLNAKSNLAKNGLYNPELIGDKFDISGYDYDDVVNFAGTGDLARRSDARVQKALNTIRGIGERKPGTDVARDRQGMLEDYLTRVSGKGTGALEKMKSLALSTKTDELAEYPYPAMVSPHGKGGASFRPPAGPVQAEIRRVQHSYFSPSAQREAMMKPYYPQYPHLRPKEGLIKKYTTQTPINIVNQIERGAWREMVGEPMSEEKSREEKLRLMQNAANAIIKETLGQ